MTADSTTRLREALSRATGFTGSGLDAIFASLVEHRNDVLDVLGMEQVGWREVRHAPGYSDDGAAFHIRPRDVYDGKRLLRPNESAWTTCEPVYAFRPKGQP